VPPVIEWYTTSRVFMSGTRKKKGSGRRPDPLADGGGTGIEYRLAIGVNARFDVS
jgi:hypothetical protein